MTLRTLSQEKRIFRSALLHQGRAGLQHFRWYQFIVFIFTLISIHEVIRFSVTGINEVSSLEQRVLADNQIQLPHPSTFPTPPNAAFLGFTRFVRLLANRQILGISKPQGLAPSDCSCMILYSLYPHMGGINSRVIWKIVCWRPPRYTLGEIGSWISAWRAVAWVSFPEDIHLWNGSQEEMNFVLSC